MTNTIHSYDFHTYWNPQDKDEAKFSDEFREKVKAEFAKELEAGDLRIFNAWDKPVGPHQIPMWEVDTGGKLEPVLFTRLLGFYQLHHGKLSVLIHPRTLESGDLRDHTEHALWLGHKQRLITSALK